MALALPFRARLKSPRSSAVAPEAAERLRILVIGSEQRTVSLLHEAGWHDHTVAVVPDGRSGHTLAARTNPDLIIVDPLARGLDALDLCRRIRADGVTAPITVLGAHNTVEECVDALDAGADDYLVEPILPQEARARLTRLLRRRGHPTPVLSAC